MSLMEEAESDQLLLLSAAADLIKQSSTAVFISTHSEETEVT